MLVRVSGRRARATSTHEMVTTRTPRRDRTGCAVLRGPPPRIARSDDARGRDGTRRREPARRVLRVIDGLGELVGAAVALAGLVPGARDTLGLDPSTTASSSPRRRQPVRSG